MKIDIETIKEEGISIRAYMDLMYIFHYVNQTNLDFVNNYGMLDLADFKAYETTGYIKISHNRNEIELRDKIRNLFEGNKDLFLTFLKNFPIKTPSGRYLSTKDEDTIKGKVLRKKWDKLFKNDKLGAEKALKVLDAEMEWRRKTNKFEFMHNAETWLNQGDFQNYAYLLSDKKTIQTKTRSDYE